MRRLVPLLLLVALVLVVAWFLGGGVEEPGDGPGEESTATVEETLAREKVAALASQTQWAQARKALAPLVEGEDAAFQDLIRAAVIELKAGAPVEQAEVFLERARAIDPDAAVIAFLDGRLADLRGELERAVAHYREALERAPDDPASKFLLAADLEYTDEMEEAKELYRELEALGLQEGGPWYVSAIYRLYQLHTVYEEDPDPELQRRYETLWNNLEAVGHSALREQDYNEGELARLVPPPPIGNHAEGPVEVPTFERGELLAPALGGEGELHALDLDGDRQLDLVVAGPDGVRACLRDARSGAWLQPLTIDERPARLLRAIDLAQDDTLDLLYVHGDALVLREFDDPPEGEEPSGARWVASSLELPALGGTPTDLELVDHDHDGDLDLLVVGTFGARLLRNDGAGVTAEDGTRGTFTDATVEAGLPTGRSLAWCATEDLDGDQDVDLLLGDGEGLLVLSSLRGGRFEDATAETFGDARFAEEPLFLDVDGDARPDALAHGSPATLWRQGRDGRFEAEPAAGDLPAGARPVEVDVDLDGRVDVLWAADDAAAAGILAVGLPAAEAVTLGGGPASGALAVGDVTSFAESRSSVPTIELLRREADGVRVWRADDVGGGLRMAFHGQKDNRQAVGAVVELRAGPIYRRHYYRGRTTVYGLGERDYADVVRITWPNGVVQYEIDVEKGSQILDDAFGEQTEGLIGSCPFLYAWNGETFVFVSDVLGITPLGLPMSPGMFVPPDHDEYVLVRGDELVPDEDGELVLQFTEELREVTYLDRARLEVVDHPAGTEVQPNERFTFPPFPEPRTHVMGTLFAPRRATGSDGADWTAELAAVDDAHAAPFEPLENAQFQGLAEPHWLELEFDPAAIAEGDELRLVCTGWFYWSDASVNLAAARTPGVEFVPPVIEVPAGDGWKPIGPPVGFPAGKSKSMVIDLSGVLDAEDPRLRIGSTLRLYWDALRLAVGGDAPQRTTSLEPIGARLWSRGFSRPLETERDTLPERFVWEELEPRPRWDQHPGRYTRFGEVLPLLTAVDDRFVVMGTGDALTIRFDAQALPPVPEGWTRDYLVFLDGWAKDRDPNTVAAENVEPLPFHGMSGYPYGPDEAFPDTEAHRAWRAEWQTREAFQWVAPLSPARQEEWAAATSR